MKSDFSPPDFRNLPRGCEWLRRMIEEMRSEADADRIIAEMKKTSPYRSREPGEDDDLK